MRNDLAALPVALLVALPGVAIAQAIPPGRWDVTSTAVDLDLPGVPGFVLRMMKGKSRAERKCVAPEQASAGIAALLAPDPKARCRVDSVRIENGRYMQMLSCPQKKGGPLMVVRNGSYDGNGFDGRLKLSGVTPKGTINVTLDQRAVHVPGPCRS